MDKYYTPVISSVVLTPKYAVTGGTVIISVNAEDIEAIPMTVVYQSGEFISGEI